MQGGRGISVAGGQPFGVAYLLDGAMHNNPYDNLNLPLPFPDALQEFRVETSSQNAQNGFHSGASVNVVTKSGTNLFHGDLFEFSRHHRFNATNPFDAVDPATGERRDDGLKRNQFGGTLGGPIMTDRLFFFGAYQGTQDRRAAVRRRARSCRRRRCWPATSRRSPRRLQHARQRHAARAVRRQPHRPGAAQPGGGAHRAASCRRPPTRAAASASPTRASIDEKQAIGKVDFQLIQNHSLFGRYMATTYFCDAAVRRVGQHPVDDARRPRQPGAVAGARRHDGAEQHAWSTTSASPSTAPRPPHARRLLRARRRRRQHLQLPRRLHAARPSPAASTSAAAPRSTRSSRPTPTRSATT